MCCLQNLLHQYITGRLVVGLPNSQRTLLAADWTLVPLYLISKLAFIFLWYHGKLTKTLWRFLCLDRM